MIKKKLSPFEIIEKIIKNRHQYIAIASHRFIHAKNDFLSYPSIFPSTPIGASIPFDLRYKLYNYLFNSYPLFSQLNQRSNNHQDCHDFIPSTYNYRAEESINLDHLVNQGFCVTENFLSNSDHSKILNALSDTLLAPPKASFSYNRKTVFKILNLTESLRASISPLQSYLNDLTALFFNKYIKTSCSVQVIDAVIDDKADPNTIPHLDRFIPTLKAFYFPFAVSDYQSPFSFAPCSHIIDSFYQQSFKDAYIFNKANNVSPFRPTPEFEQKFPLVNIVVPGNSLVLAFTNGLHRRVPFTRFPERRLSFRFDWYSSLNKFNRFL